MIVLKVNQLIIRAIFAGAVLTGTSFLKLPCVGRVMVVVLVVVVAAVVTEVLGWPG